MLQAGRISDSEIQELQFWISAAYARLQNPERARDSLPKSSTDVVQDIKVKDQVVIRAGARARGQVTESKKASMVGIPAKIGVELQSVEAIDGTIIPIRASKTMEGEDKIVLTVVLTLICLPLILLKGGDTQMSSGTTFDAFTLGTTEIAFE